MFMEAMKEQLAPIDVVNFFNTTTNFNSAVGIDMSKFKRALYVLQIGTVNTAGTLDARLQSGPNANFNITHNITGTNITQVTAGANTIVTIEVRSDQVQQQNPGDRYLRLNCVVAGSSLNIGVIGFGCEPIQRPASQYINATIVPQEVVA